MYPVFLGSFSFFPQLILVSILSGTALGLSNLQGPSESFSHVGVCWELGSRLKQGADEAPSDLVPLSSGT